MEYLTNFIGVHLDLWKQITAGLPINENRIFLLEFELREILSFMAGKTPSIGATSLACLHCHRHVLLSQKLGKIEVLPVLTLMAALQQEKITSFR